MCLICSATSGLEKLFLFLMCCRIFFTFDIFCDFITKQYNCIYVHIFIRIIHSFMHIMTMKKLDIYSCCSVTAYHWCICFKFIADISKQNIDLISFLLLQFTYYFNTFPHFNLIFLTFVFYVLETLYSGPIHLKRILFRLVQFLCCNFF